MVVLMGCRWWAACWQAAIQACVESHDRELS